MPTDEEIQNALRVLAEAGETDALRKQMLEGTPHLPKGWKSSSVAPYFRKEYAMEVKSLIDRCLLNPEHDVLIIEPRRSIPTLIQRLSQGWLYLMERMDTDDGYYKKAREIIEIQRNYDEHGRAKGIKLAHRASPKVKQFTITESQLVPVTEFKNKWKEEFEEFVESSSDGDKFSKSNLQLSDFDIEYVTRYLMNSPQFNIIKLSRSRVEILHKITPVQLV